MILIIRLKMHFVTKMLYLVDKNYRYKGGINVGIQNFFFQAEVGGGQLFEFRGGGGVVPRHIFGIYNVNLKKFELCRGRGLSEPPSKSF